MKLISFELFLVLSNKLLRSARTENSRMDSTKMGIPPTLSRDYLRSHHLGFFRGVAKIFRDRKEF